MFIVFVDFYLFFDSGVGEYNNLVRFDYFWCDFVCFRENFDRDVRVEFGKLGSGDFSLRLINVFFMKEELCIEICDFYCRRVVDGDSFDIC